ncbi:hypothetical protein J7I98_39465 [Streptomyces sp. ISL-98]|uniref:hypothetical protein n=1 Tax=Streptomyces sp. ISL-98 TaxID=2819192 RepID=UPI001BE898F7|nr:hypothetical protein [Streptomyces sp. ISL-98]MBT2511745.1 hypothetical protein [Streptomyces sp. ISL-98]
MRATSRKAAPQGTDILPTQRPEPAPPTPSAEGPGPAPAVSEDGVVELRQVQQKHLPEVTLNRLPLGPRRRPGLPDLRRQARC